MVRRVSAQNRHPMRAFTSLLSTTKTKGTGLGLAIVSRVIETHRGKVVIKSAPGRGTTMSVSLPI